MKDQTIHAVPKSYARKTWITLEKYQALYQRSIKDPQGFWAEQANEFVSWFAPWKQVLTGSFETLDVSWFVEAKLNASYNCLDRHLEKRANQVAIIWENDEGNEIKQLTYAELHQEVCKFANVLKQNGVKKGDRICIYLPMIPEIAIAMLACARIGAIHSVVFAGFSAESLKTRILDADCKLLITADEGMRNGKAVPLKINADKAIAACPQVVCVIVVKRTAAHVPMDTPRDIWYHEEMKKVDANCEAESLDANDPLFVLYTSGSTGKPKGVLHSIGGYLVYAAITHKYIFDYHDGEIYWCTADAGWITGHTYVIYGPLTNGATTLIYEGTPSYPNFSRFWNMIDRHKVNIFYTAPTAIRALRREGDEWVTRTKRDSLVLLGTVGEPINPDVWEWYYEVVGNKQCPIVDTWWQTETGGIAISPFPGATPLKAGSAAWPFFGIEPGIVNEQGKDVPKGEAGRLVIKKPWPGLMQTIYGDRDRFVDSYFKPVPGNYLTGDDAHCDDEGYYWIAGRNDDVIKVSGHRIGTGEVESALLAHSAVAEAAVVAVPDDIKGQGIYAFVTLKSAGKPTEELKKELVEEVRNNIGAIATPKTIQWAQELPKTRSGKIMRRILRKIAQGETKDLGDLSTLADPGVVDSLLKEKVE